MKAITVRQPWAWAIAHAGKEVENRGRRDPWHTVTGQRIAIHAGKGYDEDDLYDVAGLMGPVSWEDTEYLDVRGAIVATALLTGVHHSRQCRNRCSRWAQPGQWHLELAEVKPLLHPLPARGALGLWAPDQDLLHQLRQPS
jgi:hypothetical protein